MEMKSLATHPEVCDAGTAIASDGGSMTNSPNGPTIHAPPAHSNRPADPFLKGMYPGDLASTRFVKTIPCVAAPCRTVHAPSRTKSAAPRKHPARGLCNPYRIESCLGL